VDGWAWGLLEDGQCQYPHIDHPSSKQPNDMEWVYDLKKEVTKFYHYDEMIGRQGAR